MSLLYLNHLDSFVFFLGGDHIITPRQFLRDLELKLRRDDEQQIHIYANHQIFKNLFFFHKNQNRQLIFHLFKNIFFRIHTELLFFSFAYLFICIACSAHLYFSLFTNYTQSIFFVLMFPNNFDVVIILRRTSFLFSFDIPLFY